MKALIFSIACVTTVLLGLIGLEVLKWYDNRTPPPTQAAMEVPSLSQISTRPQLQEDQATVQPADRDRDAPPAIEVKKVVRPEPTPVEKEMREWLRLNVADPNAEIVKISEPFEFGGATVVSAKVRVMNSLGGWEFAEYIFGHNAEGKVVATSSEKVLNRMQLKIAGLNGLPPLVNKPAPVPVPAPAAETEPESAPQSR